MNTKTAPAIPLRQTSQRKVPRYKLTVPLDLTVLRSGIPENIPGRTLELGEGGMGAVIASQLLLGESVRVEFFLPHTNSPVRATAVVRYQRELCCGLQFVRLPAEQQSIIRYWTRSEGALSFTTQNSPCEGRDTSAEAVPNSVLPGGVLPKAARKRFRNRSITALATALLLLAGMLAWWRWQQEWAELESEIPAVNSELAKPQLKVSADVMERRIIHKVAPDYPDGARRARVQGTVVLDVSVGADGSVKAVRYVSGPVSLSSAAMRSARWWRYEPYLVNGHPTPVEATIAVDFRSSN